ncbi:MAG: alpha/beta hydrolase [Planctomyces sp.]
MRAFCLGFITLSAVLAMIGCRFPKPWHIRDRTDPIVYDTAWENDRSDNPDSANDAVRNQFRDTLAEPVSVIKWQDRVSSTWQLFYATNRGLSGDSGSRTQTYNNDVLPKPQYGTCTVVLPHRDRGDDPAMETEENSESESGRNPLIETLRPLDQTAFIADLRSVVDEARQHDVLIFVHGFNVSFDQSVLRATQVAADLPFNGVIVVYSWPSQGGVGEYARDGEVISESVAAFTDFLTEVGERLSEDCSINLVVHSMGNRLVTRSLWRLPDSFTNPPRFHELVFCAPDVGVSDFQRDVRQIIKVSQRATLYKNSNDTALIASKWRNVDERAGEALGMAAEGIDTIESAVVDTSSMGHSYYGSNPSILRDLFAVVKEHRAAEERPWLRRRKLPFTEADLYIMEQFPQPLEWRWHFDGQSEKLATQQGSMTESVTR